MCNLDIKERIFKELDTDKFLYMTLLCSTGLIIFTVFVICFSTNNILFLLVPLVLYLLFIWIINEILILKSCFVAMHAFPAFLFIIFEILVLLCFFAPIAVDIQPLELRENITLTNDYSITEFISLNNIGKTVAITCASEDISDIIKISLSDSDILLNSSENVLIKLNLTIPKTTSSGIYRGIIKIHLKTNERSIDKSVPITLNVINKIA